MPKQEKKIKKTVMVVDDEFTIRELVELSLEPHYSVIKAENGLEALEYLKSQTPDLIILDIMMPKLDGYEVCRTIKEDTRFKSIPIIMLTAKHGMEDLKNAIRADCDEYITKPFEPDFIKKRVDVHLEDSEIKKDTKRRLYQFGKSLHYIKENSNIPS